MINKYFKMPGKYKEVQSVRLLTVLTAVCILSVAFTYPAGTPEVEFTVSMENPNNHYFHVSMVYQGITEWEDLSTLIQWLSSPTG